MMVHAINSFAASGAIQIRTFHSMAKQISAFWYWFISHKTLGVGLCTKKPKTKYCETQYRMNSKCRDHKDFRTAHGDEQKLRSDSEQIHCGSDNLIYRPGIVESIFPLHWCYFVHTTSLYSSRIMAEAAYYSIELPSIYYYIFLKNKQNVNLPNRSKLTASTAVVVVSIPIKAINCNLSTAVSHIVVLYDIYESLMLSVVHI